MFRLNMKLIFIVLILCLLIGKTALLANENAWQKAKAMSEVTGDKPVMVQVENSNQKQITILYRVPELSFYSVEHQKRNGIKRERCILGNAHLYSEEGAPEIPFVKSRVFLPAGKRIKNVTFISNKSEVLAGQYNLSSFVYVI